MSENLFAYTATNSGYSEGTAGAINGERAAVATALSAVKNKIDNPKLNGDPAVLVEHPVEELESQRRHVEHGERFEDGDVHHPVGKRSVRRDVGVVAILRRVCAGDEEGLVVDGAGRVFDFVRFGPVVQRFVERIFEVRKQSPPSRVGELQADERVKPHAARAEKRVSDRKSVV